MATCGFIRPASPPVVLTECTDNLVVRDLPDTSAFGNDRATVKGHVMTAGTTPTLDATAPGVATKLMLPTW